MLLNSMSFSDGVSWCPQQVSMAADGTVFSAGCDGKGMMWTPSQGGGPQQPRQIAEVSERE